MHNPDGLGRYLTKWGIGKELAGEDMKMGRNGENMPYAAIPAYLAEVLGRCDPWGKRVRAHAQIQSLAHAWVDFVRMATDKAQTGKWFATFHRLNELVPELKECKSDVEKVATCVAIIPEEARMDTYEDVEDDDEMGSGGSISLPVAGVVPGRGSRYMEDCIR